jgi:hypothetical protein
MERGILFKPYLVRKLSSKTETRRLVYPPPPPRLDRLTQLGPDRWCWSSRNVYAAHAIRQHYGVPGDRLWVREAWAPQPLGGGGIVYRADYERDPPGIKWKPGIHLRRADARIVLDVLGVHPEPLKAITDEGAEREGFANREDFLCAWDSINGASPPAGSEFNPWVWVIRFRIA